MAILGSFGEAREEQSDTFEYFTVEMRVNPNLSELDVLDFMETAFTVDQEDPKAVLVVKKFLRSLVHDDDFENFWQLARANRQRIEDIQAVAKAIVEAVTARPTKRPSVSSRGRPATGRKSKAGSSARVLTRLEGRPDLQLAVVKAQEAQRAG
jgi:hypothetical protein